MRTIRHIATSLTLLGLLLGFVGCSAPKPEQDQTEKDSEEKDPTKTVRVTGKRIAKCEGHGTFATKIDVTRDGKLAVSTGNGDIRFWSLSEGKLVRKITVFEGLPFGIGLGHVRFSPDGKTVAVKIATTTERGVRFWEVATGKEIPSKLPQEHCFDLAYSPDGKWLATAGEWPVSAGGGLKVWELATGRKVYDIRPAEEGVGAGEWVTFSPDGNHLAAIFSAGKTPTRISADPLKDSCVRIWHLSSGKEVFAGWESFTARSLTFSPDGRFLAVGGYTSKKPKGIIRIWDWAAKKLVHTLEKFDTNLYSLAFHPDGTVLAGAGNGPLITFWSMRTWKQAGKLSLETSHVGDIKFFANGTHLIAPTHEKPLEIWQVSKE